MGITDQRTAQEMGVDRLEDINKTLSRLANNLELLAAVYIHDLEALEDVDAIVLSSLNIRDRVRAIRIEESAKRKDRQITT